MTKQIPLPRGLFALVDDADYEWLNQWKWSIGSNRYAYRINEQNRGIYMHRLITNAPNGMQVDHINGNKLDNRRENLRVCTKHENMRNRGKQKNNTSGYKGVSWREKSKRYGAFIKIDGKYKMIGEYKTAEDAARAYNEFAKKYHGKFAK